MKIHSVKPVRHVIVDTSIGIFKVYADDSLTIWKDFRNSGAFVWFDETDLSVSDLMQIREIAKKSMPML